MAVKPKLKFLTSTEGDENALGVRYIDIFDIQFLPDNIKDHDKEAIKSLIRQFGFVDPIGLNLQSGYAVFGNGRLTCLREMHQDGEECPRGIIERLKTQNGPRTHLNGRKWYAPVIDGLKFSPQDELTLAIGHNRSNETGGIDVAKAINVLKRIQTDNPEAIALTGYDTAAIEHIRHLARFQEQVETKVREKASNGNFGKVDPEASDPDFAAKLNEKWKVELGSAWQIGKHFLNCNDSALVGFDEKFRLVFTSPPYDQQRTYEGGISDWTEMMNGVTVACESMLDDPGDMIVNLGPVYQDSKIKWYWNDWLKYCDEELKFPAYGFYVWDKLGGYPGEYHGRLARSHEFFFHFSKGHRSANKWIKTTGESMRRGPMSWGARQTDGNVRPDLTSPEKLGQDYKIPDSVIRLMPEMARGIHTEGHPATFPVHLPEFFIYTYTSAGDKVYEPFAGSGTTIIACENADRICYASEISPNYCALILERYAKLFPDQEIKKL